MVKPIRMAIVAACYVMTLVCSACSDRPPAATNQVATSSVNTQNAPASTPPATTTAPSPANSSASGGGEAIDTSRYDEEIKRLEKQAEKRPTDESARLDLARAYLARGNALTGARQYRAALGDYRRALRYDPDNDEAREWAATIVGILQQMGRDVPTEGNEPPPLPMTPDTIPGDNEGSSSKEPTRKKSRQ
jgi:hypothetical protein